MNGNIVAVVLLTAAVLGVSPVLTPATEAGPPVCFFEPGDYTCSPVDLACGTAWYVSSVAYTVSENAGAFVFDAVVYVENLWWCELTGEVSCTDSTFTASQTVLGMGGTCPCDPGELCSVWQRTYTIALTGKFDTEYLWSGNLSIHLTHGGACYFDSCYHGDWSQSITGSKIAVPVQETTWGRIKAMHR
jgi:hypothetical protein